MGSTFNTEILCLNTYTDCIYRSLYRKKKMVNSKMFSYRQDFFKLVLYWSVQEWLLLLWRQQYIPFSDGKCISSWEIHVVNASFAICIHVLWQRANPRNLVYLQPLWITFKNQFFYHSLHLCKQLFRIHLSDTGAKYIVSSAASSKMVYFSLQLRWTPKVKTQIPFLQGRSWPLTFLMTFADICMRNDRCF